MATDKKTSVLIDNLLPEYLETEGPNFKAFVKAYYEWMEQTGQMTDQSKNLLNNQDLDLAADGFLKYFKREILSQFPEDILADKRLVFKKIKDLYRAKGSEESFKLLFRILYNEDIDFYLPGQDILRASDGRWIKETSLRLTKPILGNPSNMSGTITGRDSGATAKVERVTNILVDSIEVYEVFVSSIEGTFLDGEEIFNVEDNIRGTLISKEGSLQRVIILDGGSGHEKNDVVSITSSSGTGGRGTVNLTDNGVIASINVTNVGSSFLRTDPVTIQNLTRAAANGLGAPLLTAPINYTGRYNDVKGFLSWSNKLQDNRYYQEYSYVLRSSQILNTYKEIVKDIVHPAGMRLFGDVLITVEIDQGITISRENIVYTTYSTVANTFIPSIVSADIEQYTKHEELGAISDYPELEVESVPSVVDITIPDTGTGFQVEIELIAAQTSALLDADKIITVNLAKIIENVTVNEVYSVPDITIQSADNTQYWYFDTLLEVGSDVPLNANVHIKLATVGHHEVIPAITFGPLIDATVEIGIPIVEFGPIPVDSITSTFSISDPSLAYNLDPVSISNDQTFDDFKSFWQASGTVSTRYLSANTIESLESDPINDVYDVPIIGATTTRVIEGTDTLFNIEAYANSEFMIRTDPDPSTFIYGKIDSESFTFDANTFVATSNVGIITDADIFFHPFKTYEILINTSISNTTFGPLTVTITDTYSFDSANTTFDTSLTFDEVSQT